MSFIVVRKAAHEKERDEVYNAMMEGVPRTTVTLSSRAARLERDMADMVARQLNGMFPGHKWVVMPENEFRYKPLAA